MPHAFMCLAMLFFPSFFSWQNHFWMATCERLNRSFRILTSAASYVWEEPCCFYDPLEGWEWRCEVWPSFSPHHHFFNLMFSVHLWVWEKFSKKNVSGVGEFTAPPPPSFFFKILCFLGILEPQEYLGGVRGPGSVAIYPPLLFFSM